MGAVSAGVRRRVTKGPARGVILSRDRARKRASKLPGGQLNNSWEIRLDVQRDMAYDLDMRKIVDFISLGMMEYFRKQLKAGQKADGSGALPRTVRRTPGEAGRPWGLRSGYMADHWWRGKIRGGPFSAFVLIKPWGGGGGPTPPSAGPGDRAFIINLGLEHKPVVDFQSIKGRALKEFRRLADIALSAGFGDVTTEQQVRTRGGQLPEVRR